VKHPKGTYVPLFRKLLDNKKLLRDRNALAIFIWLLLRANKDTGKVETGRFAMADDLQMNPNTLHSALTRLTKTHRLCTTTSTNKYTAISILNWNDFKIGNTTTNTNETPTKHQRNTTIQEVDKLNNKKEIYKEKRNDLRNKINPRLKDKLLNKEKK